MKKILLIAAVVSGLFSSITSYAQKSVEEKFISYSKMLSGEKLYLHTDREIYNIGDTIWIKAYLRNVSEISEYKECNYIYVEILSTKWEMSFSKNTSVPVERVRKRVKIKRNEEGNFVGYMPLDDDFNSGLSTLRAYSYWMMNSEPYTLFSKTLEIRNPMKDDFAALLKEAEFTDQGVYQEFGIENPFKKSIFTRKKKNETDVDIQFLPESGSYVAGASAVMAVKAINGLGMGVKLSGRVYADSDEIAQFETNDLGMGRFSLVVPESAKVIKAVCETAVENFEYEARLPKPAEAAVMINLRPDAKGVNIVTRAVAVPIPDSSFLVVYDRSQIIFKSHFSLQPLVKRIEYSDLESGINNVAVVDIDGNVYAQRSFFVFPSSKPAVSMTSDKDQYGKREKAGLEFSLKNADGSPLKGNFSVAVTDEEYSPYSGESHNIESYLLLGSELEGYIEKPQYYFCDTVPMSRRMRDMDYLMMTQGWKYYDLEKILKEKSLSPRYGREYTQSLSGYVLGVIGKSRRSTLCFVAPSLNYTQIAEIDSTAYFALNGLDFPDGTEFLVGAQGKKGIFRKWYTPVMAPEYYAPEVPYPNYLKYRGYDRSYADNVIKSYSANGGVLSYNLTPSRIVATKDISPYPGDTFKPGEYRGEDKLLPYRDLDMFTYILTTCPGVRLVGNALSCRTARTGQSMTSNSPWVAINILINGFSVTQNELESLMVSDVEAVAYVTGSSAYKYQFIGGGNINSLDNVLYTRATVLIKTKFPPHSASNALVDKPMGWQKPASRYVPKYETALSLKKFETIRPTLHWIPTLNVENGVGKVDFYTSDHSSPYTVILEGLTDKGQPVFFKSELNTSVK